VTSNSRWKTNL